MKKKIVAISCTIAAFCISMPQTSGILHANDYASNETYYRDLCKNSQSDSSLSDTCRGFQTYLQEKSNSLREQASSLDEKVASIKNDINSVQENINEIQKTIDLIDDMIAQNEAEIITIQGTIRQLDGEILQTQEDIKVRDLLIKDRMTSEQAALGTNVYVEFIMGAKDLVELMRIVEGIERITDRDQSEIAALEDDKKKLNQQKEEQTRLKEDQELKKADNEKNKQTQEEVKKQQNILIAEYQKQEADLVAQIRAANTQAANAQKIIAEMNASYVESSGFMAPVSGRRSEGTFFYSGGGFHAGLDFAAGVGTPIYAPIGGIVVYANNPYGSNSGYLGNYVGWPAGAGNSVHMIGTVNGTTYGISFFHMAQENFVSYAGRPLSQGEVIGSVGHSGNSTGAHCHVEIINLGGMSTEEAIARFKSSGADFAWGTGWNTTSTACAYNGGSTPCREKPESYF